MTEFGLIAHIRAMCKNLPDHGFEGIGDDCASLPIGGGEALVFTADMLCEGVHFLRAAITPEELGAKSLAVNLSDVAAMGVRPVATLLSMSLPAEVEEAWVERFMAGYLRLSERYGIALIGGDTTASEGGITINVTAIGRGAEVALKHRRNAQAGDVLCCLGPLGASGAGLRDILAGRYDTTAAALHRNPVPQVDEGAWLGTQQAVHAMMDLSDGLASDVRHIMEESKVGCRIDLDAIPVAPEADLQTAACGGEDYKLLFTVEASAVEPLGRAFEAQFHAPLYPIGTITDDGALRWCRGGSEVALDWQGFRHF